MINIKKPVPKDLPVLTDVVDGAPVELPTLTEVIEETAAAVAPELPPHLLGVLETHIENLLLQKLKQHWADAQQHAIEQAVADLKQELPQLIRETLATPHKPL